jgi:hypothetical protein
MFAEAMEWEAKGDGLRKAKRYAEAVEAYRTALRHCFQWRRDARACSEIREKIWAVQIEEFVCFAASHSSGDGIDEDTALMASIDTHPDTLEMATARLWVCGARTDAERLVEAAVRAGARGSGELLDRLAAHYESTPDGVEAAEWMRSRAVRLRGGNRSSELQSAAQHA